MFARRFAVSVLFRLVTTHAYSKEIAEHPLVTNFRSHQENLAYPVKLWQVDVAYAKGSDLKGKRKVTSIIGGWLGTYIDLYPEVMNDHHFYVRDDLKYVLFKSDHRKFEIGDESYSNFWGIWELGVPSQSSDPKDVLKAMFELSPRIRGRMHEPYAEALLNRGIMTDVDRTRCEWVFYIPNGETWSPVEYLVASTFVAPFEELVRGFKLGEYNLRPLRKPLLYPADLTTDFGSFRSFPIINLHTLGSHTIQNIRGSRGQCFAPGYHPMLCCRPTGAGNLGASRFCWWRAELGRSDEDWRKTCCRRFSIGFNRSSYRESLPPLSRESSPPKPSDRPLVDIFVRTYHGDAYAVEALLTSILVFWPTHWGTTVYIAMDSGSKKDEQFCKSLHYVFVQCLYLPLLSANSVMIDNLLADLHIPTEPKYIAFVDADVVFHSYNIPEILFVDRKPVLHASRRYCYIMNPLSLGMDYVGEFMDSFPFLVDRLHLAELRSFIKSQMGLSDFVDAYRMFMHFLNHTGQNHARHRAYQDEGDCPQQILGTFLFYTQKHEYHFALEDGLMYGLPPYMTCPALRAATHLWQAKHVARENDEGKQKYARLAHRIIERGKYRSERPAMDRLLLSPDNQDNTMWAHSSSLHCRQTVQMLLKWYYGDASQVSCPSSQGILA